MWKVVMMINDVVLSSLLGFKFQTKLQEIKLFWIP